MKCSACRDGRTADCSGIAVYTPASYVPCETKHPQESLTNRQTT